MHVEHFMTKDPVACDDTDTAGAVGKLMGDKGVGAVVVLRGGKVAGMVTDRQLACCVLGQDLGPDTPVSEFMTENPARLTMDDTIFTAVDTLRSAGVVRRVPVVNQDDELVGIVSISDIAVVAEKLVDALMLEAKHTALHEAHVLTGGKRVAGALRRPSLTATGGLPEQETRPVLTPATGREAASERTPERRHEAPKGILGQISDALTGKDTGRNQ